MNMQKIRKTLLNIALASVLMTNIALAQDMGGAGGNISGSIGGADTGISDVTGGGTNKASFTTPELILNTGPGLMECSHYCIVGIQVRFIYIPPPVNYLKIFYTPIVRHNTSDFVVMSGTEIDEMPWEDYQKLMGQLSKKIGDRIILSANKNIGGEVGGGISQSKQYGNQQSLTFKDAAVVGNPMAYVVESLDNVIDDKKHYYGNPDAVGNIEDEVASELGDLADVGLDEALDLNLDMDLDLDVDFMSDAMAEMDKTLVQYDPNVLIYVEMVKQVVDTFADSMDDMVVDYYGCATAAKPRKAYYTSNLDGIFWRNGYPITDAHKSTTIMNPISSDTIKPSMGDEIENITDLGSSILEGLGSGWGHVYPRSGFLNNANDYQIGAVIAYRGMNVASEAKKRRLRRYDIGKPEDVMWQQTHPTPGSQCYYNIANSIHKEDNNEKRNYAWNGYRRYQCGLTEFGFFLADIIFGDDMICLGQGPTDKNGGSGSTTPTAPSAPAGP